MAREGMARSPCILLSGKGEGKGEVASNGGGVVFGVG